MRLTPYEASAIRCAIATVKKNHRIELLSVLQGRLSRSRFQALRRTIVGIWRDFDAWRANGAKPGKLRLHCVVSRANKQLITKMARA